MTPKEASSRARKINRILATLRHGPPLVEVVNVPWDDPERGYMAQYGEWVVGVMDQVKELK